MFLLHQRQTRRFQQYTGIGFANIGGSDRHHNESQRALVASRLANIKNGGDRKSDQSANLRTDSVSQSEAADLLHVSRRLVQAATELQRIAPEAVDDLDRIKLASYREEILRSKARENLRARTGGLTSAKLPKSQPKADTRAACAKAAGVSAWPTRYLHPPAGWR
ncbi:MAG TPA: hypothetical protein PKJ98_16680 [Verrucomicrobiota bacterium]|nr:hypothetical protein [Verrucomicrobiota bacterium]